LPNHEVNGDLLGTKTYSDIVYVGNSFIFHVEEYNVTSDIKPEAETLLKQGDELKFTIINEPEVNFSEAEEAILGIAGSKYVNITRNGLVFDSLEDFLIMPYIIVDAIVVPVSSQQIEAEGSNNTMELMQDLFDNPEEGYSVIKNEITERCYEIEYTFEFTQMSGYIHRKYDVNTGLVLLSHEDVVIFATENPEEIVAYSNILLISNEEEAMTTANPMLTIYLSILILALVLTQKKRKKGN
jgi:hypothetical protein